MFNRFILIATLTEFRETVMRGHLYIQEIVERVERI